MTVHPIDSWSYGIHVGEYCDQCTNRADVVIEETAEEFEASYLRWFGHAPGPGYFQAGTASMLLCFDCTPDCTPNPSPTNGHDVWCRSGILPHDDNACGMEV